MEKGIDDMTYFPPKEFILNKMTLRGIQGKDAQGIFDIRNNLNMIKYTGIPQMLSMEDADRFVVTRIEGMKNNKWFYWIIANETTDQLMGTICLYNFNDVKQSCEVGYELLPAYQGNGYVAQAMSLIIQFAFNILNQQSVFADINEANLPSLHVIERAGFKFLTRSNGFKLYSISADEQD